MLPNELSITELTTVWRRQVCFTSGSALI